MYFSILVANSIDADGVTHHYVILSDTAALRAGKAQSIVVTEFFDTYEEGDRLFAPEETGEFGGGFPTIQQWTQMGRRPLPHVHGAMSSSVDSMTNANGQAIAANSSSPSSQVDGKDDDNDDGNGTLIGIIAGIVGFIVFIGFIVS